MKHLNGNFCAEILCSVARLQREMTLPFYPAPIPSCLYLHLDRSAYNWQEDLCASGPHFISLVLLNLIEDYNRLSQMEINQ